MAQGIKIKTSIIQRKIDSTLSPQLRRGLKAIGAKTACYGIKDHGDLAKIMGVLNYGDPGHTFPNTGKDSDRRQDLDASNNDSAIPARPWLDKTSRGIYGQARAKYIKENIGRVIAGIPKRGQSRQFKSSQRAMTVEDFAQGLANVGAQNARDSWNASNFEPNAPATLENKSDPRPLHDTGRMNADAITGWIK